MGEATGATARRRVLAHPLLWAAALALVAWAWLALAAGVGAFLPFLIALAAGVLAGQAALTALGEVPGRAGWMLHAAIAVAAVAVLWFLVAAVGVDVPRDWPTVLRAAAVVLGTAAGPAVAWVAIGLLARVGASVQQVIARRAPDATADDGPHWARSGGTWTLRVTAVPMRLRTVGWMILGVVVVLGAVGAGLAILLDPIVPYIGARGAVVVLALALGLPVYALLRAGWRRRARDYALRADERGIGIQPATEEGSRVEPPALEAAWTDVASLQWIPDTEYARVVVRTRDGATVSLLAGIARLRAAREPLPPLPDAIAAAADQAGVRRLSGRAPRSAPTATPTR